MPALALVLTAMPPPVRTLLTRLAGGIGLALAVVAGVLLHSAVQPTVTLSVPFALPVVLLAAVALVVFAATRERTEAARRQAGLLADLQAANDRLTAQAGELARERDEARLLESAVVYAHDAVVVLDPDPRPGTGRRVRYANDAFCRMTGYAWEEVVGRSLYLLRGPGSDQSALDRIRAALDAARPLQAELQNYRKDGSAYWVEMSLVPIPGPSGGVAHWVVVQREVTDRKLAEEELRQTGQLLRLIVDAFPGLISAKDEAGRYLLMNRYQAELYGTTPEGAVGKTAGDLITPEYGAYAAERDRRVTDGGQTIQLEESTPDAKGVAHHWLTLKAPLRDPDGPDGQPGPVCGLVNVSLDVSAMKAVQEALREREELLRAVGDNLPDGAVYQLVVGRDKAERFAYVSAGVRRLYGLSPEEILADVGAVYGLIHPEDRAGVAAAEQAAFRAMVPFDHEFRSFTRTGELKWLHVRSMPTPQADGRSVWNGLVMDVTARRQAEEAVRRSEGRYRLLFDRNPHPMWVYDQQTLKFLAVNDAAVRTYGYSRDEFLGMTVTDIRGPADGSRLMSAVLAAGEHDPAPDRHQKKDGGVIDVEAAAFALNLDDRPAELVLAIDVTERRRAESALRRSEALFRGIFESTSAGVSLSDASGRFTACNPAFAAMLGRPAEEVLRLAPADVTHPDDWAAQLPLVEEVRTGRRDRIEVPKRYVRPDGEVVWAELTFAAIRGPRGRFEYGLGVSLDVTERRRLEEELRRAQKLEAIGQMAGGVAHDFNNLLTAVLGSLGLVRLPPGDPNRPLLVAVEQAAARAADLTRKLLGYARRNQLLPGPVDPRQAFTEVTRILHRTLDPRVAVVVEVAAGCGPALADAGLLNQALMNLCLNARDAMPAGGTLTLTAEPVAGPADRPGPFVRLGVTDTGAGMTDDVKTRMFDPFFTTKEVGTGSGLGLAMVHGVVEQHDGWVECTSAPGAGTRVDLYLPAATAAGHDPSRPTPPPIPRPEPREPRAIPATADPLILLVDDEAMIRDLGRMILDRAGYRVLTASDGVEAVEVFTRDRTRISLVILDVTMPRMSGRDAYQHITRLAPEARVMFSTGYSADDVAGVEGAVGLLHKPYRPHDLLAAVRTALAITPVGDAETQHTGG